jgi:hypothetical protein
VFVRVQGNKKFNDMLAERLAEEDNLKVPQHA